MQRYNPMAQAVLRPHAELCRQMAQGSDGAHWLHFNRFLECLCLNDGAHLRETDVADAVHWHSTMLEGQKR